MKKILLTALLLPILTLATVYSQKSYSGFVIDTDGNTLPGATISILEKNQHFKGGTTTDEQGFFRLALKENEILKISYIGYEEQSIRVEALREDNWISLQPSIYNLDAIVVVANEEILSTNCTIYCGYTQNAELRPQGSEEEKYNLEERPWNYYPNPTNGPVEVITSEERAGFLEIINNSGQLLKRIQITDSVTQLDLGHFPAGMYHLRYSESGYIENIGPIIRFEN